MRVVEIDWEGEKAVLASLRDISRARGGGAAPPVYEARSHRVG